MGGYIWGIPGHDRPYPENLTVRGFASFIPSIDGGFIGRQFVFVTFPTFKGGIYADDFNKFNVFATQDTTVSIYRADGSRVQEMEVRKFSMVWTAQLEKWEVYRITSSGNILVYGTTAESMAYVPCLTGGFVGRSFMTTRAGDVSMGDRQSFIVVAMQDAKVEFYDMRKPEGSAADLVAGLHESDMRMITYFADYIPVMVKSTGNITLLSGSNQSCWGTTKTTAPGYLIPQYIAEDITVLGAKEGQEVGFFAPYEAILFASGDTDIEVNGIPRSMRKDEFVRLASGAYTVRPIGAPVIVEVVGDTDLVERGETTYISKFFEDWGTYLISPQTLYKSYEVEEKSGGLSDRSIGTVGAVALVALIMAMRRKRAKALTQLGLVARPRLVHGKCACAQLY